MKFKLKQDQLFGIIIILIACFLFYITSTIKPVRLLDPNDAGPKFFPNLISCGILICGLGMLIMPDKDQTKFLEGPHWKKVFLFFGMLAGYLILMYFVGFRIATPIGLFAAVNMLSTKKLNQIVVAVYSIAFAFLLYFSFSTLLKILLPRGILFM